MVDCILLFSGGLDSTTILLDLLEDGYIPLCLIADYGQDHKVEVDFAKQVCETLGVYSEVVVLPLIGKVGDIVHGRNLLLLSLANCYAQKLDVSKIYNGFCEADGSGFPDCTENFVHKVESCIKAGYSSIEIVSPLLNVSKRDTFYKNYYKGRLRFIIENTLTCYEGFLLKNSWGYGCGKCTSCISREKGYNDFKEYYL